MSKCLQIYLDLIYWCEFIFIPRLKDIEKYTPKQFTYVSHTVCCCALDVHLMQVSSSVAKHNFNIFSFYLFKYGLYYIKSASSNSCRTEKIHVYDMHYLHKPFV